MPVSAQDTVFHYTANGATVTFPFGCQVLQAADLKVYVNDERVNSGFTVSGIGAPTGGTVSFNAPPANLTQVRIERDIVLERQNDYQQNGDFLARVVNPDFNRLWMALQQHLAIFNRALLAPKSESRPLSTLPKIAERAGKLLSFDAAGQPIAVLPTASSASFIVWIQNAIGAIKRTIQEKLSETITPEDFGAVGDGIHNDTAALNLWAAAIRDQKRIGQCRSTTYGVSQAALGVMFIGFRNTTIHFNGAVFKALDGDAVSGGRAGFTFRDCDDCDFYEFTYDGNRSMRVPAEVFCHNINIADGNKRIRFWNCRSVNPVCDAWYISPETPANQALYPTDVQLHNCEGINAFRNNLSLIGSVRFRMFGGRLNGANGTLPQAGFDVEPDAVTVHGNYQFEFHNVETSENLGYGRQYGGPASVVIENPDGLDMNPRGVYNAQGFMNIVRAKGLRVVSAEVGPHSASTRGLIDVASGAVDVSIESPRFRDIGAAGGAISCLYVHALAAGTKITDVRAKNIACPVLNVFGYLIARGVFVDGCTSNAPVIGFSGVAAANSELSDAYVKTSTGRALYVAAPNCLITEFTSINSSVATGAGAVDFDVDAAGSVLRGAKIMQTGGAVPANQVAVRALCPMTEISSVSALGGYTNGNTLSISAANAAGARIFGITPDPLSRVVPTGPANYAVGQTALGTTTITAASLGDRVHVTCDLPTPGVQLFGSVNNAAGQIAYYALNNSGAVVPVAAANIRIAVNKA